MKLMIILFLSLFIGWTSFGRGPVDPISPPWPLRTLPVDKRELPGRWIGINFNTIWVIEINPYADEQGRSGIKIKSNSIKLRTATGWFLEEKNVFLGQVIEGQIIYNIMIFRDEKGTKLRLADTHGYFDLKLFKNE